MKCYSSTGHLLNEFRPNDQLMQKVMFPERQADVKQVEFIDEDVKSGNIIWNKDHKKNIGT